MARLQSQVLMLPAVRAAIQARYKLVTSNDFLFAPGFERRPGYPMSFQPVAKRIRAEFAGTTIIDASHAMVMLEDGHRPVYYFRRDEVRMNLLNRTAHSSH